MPTNLVEPSEATFEAFDYGLLDAATASEAKAVVGRYRTRTETYVFDTGRDLLAIKERLEHGQFLDWVRCELRLTSRSAQRFMSVAHVLGPISDTVSYLPPTVLYKLSAPATSEAARKDIINRIGAGESVSPKQIIDHLSEAGQQARREAAEAQLSAMERKKQATRKRRVDARDRRNLEKAQRAAAEMREKATAATNELAAIFAACLDAERLQIVRR